MHKVIVIGCPGSGKSTFSRRLRDITGMPLYYLDMLYHKPDRTTYTREEFDEKLSIILQKDEWIIDGNYNRTIPVRLEKCDTVIWLDYPVEVCLNGIETRYNKPREDMPWIEMGPDEEFLDFIRNFRETKRPVIEELLARTSDKTIYTFHSRDEAAAFLDKLSKEVLI